MKRIYIFGIAGLLGILLLTTFITGHIQFDFDGSEQLIEKQLIKESQVSTNCVPTFADGGGPYYKANAPFRDNIAPENNNGEKLIIRGQVLKNDCVTPIADVVLDIWQANETGSYQDEWYRGKVQTDNEGNYFFETVIPKGYGEGTGYRPPHIHFKVFVDNVEIITSQMFFPQVKGTPGFDEAYIMKLDRKTEGKETINEGYHDIILPQ